MSLYTISRRYKMPNDKIVVAYKIFIKEGKVYKSVYKQMEKKYLEGREYKATGKIRFGLSYPAGFHAYCDLKETVKHFRKIWSVGFSNENYTICEVHLWNLCCLGIQGKRKAVVAKKMRIVAELNRKGEAIAI